VKSRIPVVLVLAALSLAACGSSADPPGGLKISKGELGDAWPLTVSSGTLYCTGKHGVGAVTFRTGGKTYALNTAASGQGLGRDITSIWANDPKNTGMKKAIGPLITKANTLCK